MPSKYQTTVEMVAHTAKDITSHPETFMSFLETAANNYKYGFRDQMLIFAQKPYATACAEIEVWNKLGRYVNRGTKGIALLVDRDVPYKLRHVFDISDTNSYYGNEVRLWTMKPEYEELVTEALENSFGEVENKKTFSDVLLEIAELAVTDNLPDYCEQLKTAKSGSFLEEIDNLNTEVYFKGLLKNSVAYMLLTRCGYDGGEYLAVDDFRNIFNFNTVDTLNILGCAGSDISEMILQEVAVTVKAAERETKKQNRTFASPNKTEDNISENKATERSTHNGTDIQTGGRLSSAEHPSAGQPEDREIWNAAPHISKESQENDVVGASTDGQAERTSGTDRPSSERDDGEADNRNSKSTGRERNAESDQPNEVGADDEQHQGISGGNRAEGNRLQLSGHDYDAHSEIPYYHEDDEKAELLRNCIALKDHRKEIATFFAEHEDRRERGNFIKGFFDNTYVEHILESGQRVGYRAYDDLLTMWRGSYLTREKEDFMSWERIANKIYGLMLLHEWLSPDEQSFLTVGEQIKLIEEAATEKDKKFVLPQEAIDYVLCGGSNVSQSKFRIYEQFLKQESKEKNIAFLKSEYGIGGHSDALPESGYWEQHDGKGIEISKDIGDNKKSLTLSWSNVEKRIGELINAGRYFAPAEREVYPAYKREAEDRNKRYELMKEFRSIFEDYNDFERQLGNESAVFSMFELGDCASKFTAGEKRCNYVTDKPFILPIMRKALQKIIDSKTHLTERAEKMLEALSGDLAKPFEPTYDELNPPPEPPKEYRFSLGGPVYIGTKEYSILSLDGDTVTLNDSEFPLFCEDMLREEFDRKVSGNPMNDKYLHVVESVIAESEATLAPPPEQKKQGKLSPSIIFPEIKSDYRTNFRIEDDNIGVGTPLDRFYNNVHAIQLLRKLEAEHRLANGTEQRILSAYVGWGGLPQFFEETNSHYAELKELLSENEYASARASALTAFYTPPVVIKAIYKAFENMNFKSGNVLEPSCGIGNFMGLVPDSMKDAKFYGIELDAVSGRIAQQLYQKNSIAVQGFEDTKLPDSFFDAAVGNVPFGQFKVPDKRYDKHNFLIHDYFFARTLDKVRPGGIIAFITSKGTMDKENPAIRKYIAQRADLLGAIRLPNNTFKDAAGTEVTSDIIFLQKRDRLIDIEPAWVHLGTDENGIKMNSYFVDNPDMIMGEMKMITGPHSMQSACIAYEDQSLSEQLTQAIENIHAEVTEYEYEDLTDEEEDLSIPADPEVRNFSYTVVDGKIYYRENSRMKPVDVSVTAENRIKGMIGIRDCVRMLIEYQTEDYPESDIKAEQEKLNELYDAFSKKYGLINSRANNSAFNSDSSYSLLSSLEVLDDEGNFVRKADMFSKRTIKQKVTVASVDTASEALALSLAEKTKIDVPYMCGLTGKSEEEIAEDLSGVIFLNPFYSEGYSEPKYIPADEYLSGNVREKLATAKTAAESDTAFEINVKALMEVMPKDLTASEISVRLGATWLPPEDVEQFMFELFSTSRYISWNIHVHYSEYTGEWNIEGKSYDRGNIKVYNTYGTSRINGYKIIEETLNLRDVRIFDYVEDENGNKKPVLNKKETAIAQGKQQLIKDAFADWIWKDQERRDRLCKLYNEKFNSVRPREYNGEHLNFVGINPEITLRPHQVNAIAHILYGGNTLLAHVVGAGKTFEMVAAAQESKRLGLCQKSLFVVPNHLTEQWAAEYLQLYPSANILVASKKDFETKNRKKFCGRIATGDYDAIIIGHSQFEKIPMSIERQQAILSQQLEEIMNGIAELKKNRGENFSIKQLEKSKKTVKQKLDKLNDQTRKDDVVTFEELGVDRLFIDEAHYYKNLAAFTKMRNVGGISQTEAQKSSDLYMKCRYLDELTGGKGVVFATGTPISNTMVELYTMQKYLQYNLLKRNNLIHFDSWASTFGETVTAIELAPEGSGYRAKTRFAKFYNLPELMSLFKETADIQTADMLNLPVPKANYHNVVLKPSEQQKEMVKSLSERAEKVRNKMVDSSVDNMLLITNDGRKLALDQRMINEMLPDSETSKVSACADNVFDIWQKTADERSTQMVFCDLSTPHGDGSFNVYDDLRDKLIAKGVPKEEIAYIHSANTEMQKKELFGKVRSGQVRVLIGSTQKMGAGTNVQKKLIALHHLDCPWRPSDLQQREGRIIRQGNDNPEVEIFTYVTENTFDSYLYQLVESKQNFIGQIMTSKSPVRSAEDVDEQALSYAEIKALCTGNPYIKEKMDLDIDVSRLKLLKANHLSQIYSLEDKIHKEFPQKIAALEERIRGYEKDIATAESHPVGDKDSFCGMVIKGLTFSDKKEAGEALIAACKSMTNPDPIRLGSYRGFDMELSFDTFSKEYKVVLVGELRHTIVLGTDIFGNILRLDNAIGAMPERQIACKEQLEDTKVQLENAKVESKKPFPHEEELKTKSARLAELNTLLDMDKKDNEIVDGERSEEADERDRADSRDAR